MLTPTIMSYTINRPCRALYIRKFANIRIFVRNSWNSTIPTPTQTSSRRSSRECRRGSPCRCRCRRRGMPAYQYSNKLVFISGTDRQLTSPLGTNRSIVFIRWHPYVSISNLWLNGPIPNGISVSSAVFACPTSVSIQHTDTQTMLKDVTCICGDVD